MSRQNSRRLLPEVLVWAPLGVAIMAAAAGCRPSPGPGPTPQPDAAKPTPRVTGAAEPAALIPTTWVGRQAAQGCPPPAATDRWELETLWATQSAAACVYRWRGTGPRPRIDPAAAPAGLPANSLGEAPLGWLTPDVGIVAPMCAGPSTVTRALHSLPPAAAPPPTSAGAANRGRMQQRFRCDAGGRPPSSSPCPTAADVTPIVEVAVIDDMPATGVAEVAASADYPTPDPVKGVRPSFHGAAVTGVISELACGGRHGPGSGCPLKLTHYPALRYGFRYDAANSLHVAEQYDSNGQFGTLSDLALAVRDAVDAWTTAGQGNLVLNLSLGWREENLRSTKLGTAAIEAGTALVQREVRRARCAGALVLAAVGETRSRCAADDPLFPAAWEAVPAPSKQACTDEFGLAPEWTDPGCRPLVFAVGGTDRAGQLLAGTPVAEGLPRLVAPGYGAVADRRSVLRSLHAANPASCDPTGLGWSPTVPLTGSSMSTAAVSAAAASVWALRPEDRADDIVALLYDSGHAFSGGHAVATLLPACWEVAPPPPKRVTLARGVAVALAKNGVDCNALAPDAPAADAQACCRARGCSGSASPAPLGPMTAGASAVQVPPAIDWCAAESDPCCGGQNQRRKTSTGACPAPDPAACSGGSFDYPWVNPAPTDPPCPPDECLVDFDWSTPTGELTDLSLTVTVPSDLGLHLDAEELVISVGGTTVRITLEEYPQLVGLAPGASVEVRGLPIHDLSGSLNSTTVGEATAELQMTLTGTGGREYPATNALGIAP